MAYADRKIHDSDLYSRIQMDTARKDLWMVPVAWSVIAAGAAFIWLDGGMSSAAFYSIIVGTGLVPLIWVSIALSKIRKIRAQLHHR